MSEWDRRRALAFLVELIVYLGVAVVVLVYLATLGGDPGR